MPIEDVDFLKHNSVRQSYVFLVDSTDRDRMVYPDPNSYVIEFTQPFHAVVGLEVLDGSIPRTMYNIDVYNNSLCFFIHLPSYTPDSDVDPGFVTVRVEPGDYTMQTLMVALNQQMSMTIPGTEMTAQITVESVTNPPDIKNQLRFHCPFAFMFDMSRSTIAESLGFDLLVDPNESTKPLQDQRYRIVPGSQPATDYTTMWQNASVGDIELARKADAANALRRARFFHSVDRQDVLGASRVVFSGPRSVIRKLPVTPSAFVAQRFLVTARGFLSRIDVALTTDILTSESKAYWDIYTDAGGALGAKITSAASVIALSYVDGGYSDSYPSSPIELTEGLYWIVFHGTDDTTSIYYNDTVTYGPDGVPLKNTMRAKAGVGASWASLDTDIHFEASVNITMQDTYHYVTAPGIVSLVGERYVVVRCPEIEEHCFRSLAYSRHSLGLAKFRLGVVGFSENRVDFTRTPTREFHPIGRLTRMSIRFETNTGKLYDFKGVNHNITFVIHYLEPVQKEQFKASVLNPNYNANYVEYMYANDHEDEESDDQEYDYSRDDGTNYEVHESRHLPETIAQIDRQALYHI